MRNQMMKIDTYYLTGIQEYIQAEKIKSISLIKARALMPSFEDASEYAEEVLFDVYKNGIKI